jgi:hypothetical protein
VKVTVTPPIGLPCASLTVACSGCGNGARILALCGVPPEAWIDAAVPAVMAKGSLVAERTLAASAVSV